MTGYEWSFVVALAMLGWVYLGFPVVLFLRARRRPRPFRDDGAPVPVSVVLAAYDEAEVIAARIINLLEQDYPSSMLEVVVVCDGGDDGTYEAASRYDGRQVRVVNLPRVGKAAAMNFAMALTNNEIVAFTDANTIWEKGALRALVAPFVDETVGGVVGDQVYVGKESTDGVSAGEHTYWTLDRALKVAQSAAGNVTSATGAIHALRRELLERIPGNVTDDFFLSTGAIRERRRLVFAPGARAVEALSPSPRAEFSRKVRIITRGFNSVRARSSLLNPFRHGFYSLQLFTHKVLRRLAFIPLLVLFTASLLGMRSVPWMVWAAALQGLFYVWALFGLAFPSSARTRLARLLRLPAFFVMTYAAAAVAVFRVLTGRGFHIWAHERQAIQPAESTEVRSDEDPGRALGSSQLAYAVSVGVILTVWAVLGAQPAIAAGAFLAGAAILIVGLPRPSVWVPIALGLTYLNAPVVMARRIGIAPEVGALAITGVLGLVAFRLLIKERRRFVLPAAGKWMFLYLGVVALSMVLSRDPARSIQGAMGFVTEGVLLYLLVVYTIRDFKTLRRSLWVLASVAAALALMSIYQAVTRSYGFDFFGLAGARLPEGIDVTETLPKPTGPIGDQNRWGQTLLMIVPIPVMIALRHSKIHVRAIAGATALTCLVGVVLTTSRGTAIAAVGLLITLVVTRSIRLRALVIVIACVAGALMLFPNVSDRLVATAEAFTEDDPIASVDGAVIGRLSSQLGAVRVFLDNPILGVGLRNYPNYHKEAVEDLGLRVVPDREPHNLYPQVAAETGILGLVTFGGIVLATLREVWHTRRRSPQHSELQLFAEAMFLGVLTYLYSAVFLHLAFQRYFWMLMALTAAVSIVAGETRRHDQVVVPHQLTPT